MSKNERFVDSSIHHISGVVITGNATVGNVNNVVMEYDRSINWELLLQQLNEAMAHMSSEQCKIFAESFDELRDALTKKDKSKLRQCAEFLGKFGIDFLQNCSANVLAGVLLKLIGA